MAPTDPFQLRAAGLRRLARVKRWIVAGSVTLTGALAAVAANAVPGKTINGLRSQATSELGVGETAALAERSGEGSSSTLTPPAQAPQSGEEQEPGPQSTPSEQGGAQSEPETPVISGGS